MARSCHSRPASPSYRPGPSPYGPIIMICFGMSELDIKNLKRSLTRIGHGGGDAKPLDNLFRFNSDADNIFDLLIVMTPL